MKSQKPVTMKDGTVVDKGAKVTFIAGNHTQCILHGAARDYTVRITSAFKVPGQRSIARWSWDSVCKTVTGQKIEPDGVGSDNAPSWMLVLGYV